MHQTSNHRLTIVKCGAPVLRVEFRSIKLTTVFLILFLAVDLLFSFKLFISAIQIRSHLGYYINMISSGDGDILPSLLAVPVLFFLLIDVVIIFLLYLAFDPEERPGCNLMMFVTVITGAFFLFVLFVLIICVISHAYSKHQSLHDGIVTAMNNYSTNLVYKSQIDRLQIEFQCCGSKKYDEWYTIKWYDPSLEQGTGGSSADGNTPFSCCSIKSLFPCIHHNIEITGKAYLYTPEFNLSISTRGCYEMIRKKKQSTGWEIVGNLFSFMLLQGFTVATFRLIQTAHFENSRFSGRSKTYTMWIFGCYSGRVKKDPPEPPPLPPELED